MATLLSSDPVRLTGLATARLHSSLQPTVTIFLHAGLGYSLPACLALTDNDPAMRVLRRESGTRIVRDTVLDGSSAPRSKWLGHWIIRLAALHGGIGFTNALILAGVLRPELAACVSLLACNGASIHYGCATPTGDTSFPTAPDRGAGAPPIRPLPI